MGIKTPKDRGETRCKHLIYAQLVQNSKVLLYLKENCVWRFGGWGREGMEKTLSDVTQLFRVNNRNTKKRYVDFEQALCEKIYLQKIYSRMTPNWVITVLVCSTNPWPLGLVNFLNLVLIIFLIILQISIVIALLKE